MGETPEHALTEVLRWHQGKRLRDELLLVPDRAEPGRFHRRALVEVHVPAAWEDRSPDLGDPATLLRYDVRPDALASEDRRRTQEISRGLHRRGDGPPGFRWWSALRGDWHSRILFLDRVDGAEIRYGTPEPLTVAHPVVRRVAAILRMEL